MPQKAGQRILPLVSQQGLQGVQLRQHRLHQLGNVSGVELPVAVDVDHQIELVQQGILHSRAHGHAHALVAGVADYGCSRPGGLSGGGVA